MVVNKKENAINAGFTMAAAPAVLAVDWNKLQTLEITVINIHKPNNLFGSDSLSLR